MSLPRSDIVHAGRRKTKLHQAGDEMITVRGQFGQPHTGRTIFWFGKGNHENYGLGAYLHAFVSDSWALGVGIDGSLLKPPGKNVFGVEVEGVSRHYLTQSADYGVFWDFTGGFIQTSRGFPPGGTRWNFTFGFGPGLELPVGSNTDLLVGGYFHHMSNGLGRDTPRNPSQNDLRFWLGIGWTL